MKLKLLAVLLASAVSVQAHAATFTFAGSGGGFTSSGLFTTTNSTTTIGGRQAYTITSISGLLNGAAITSLLPTGTNFGGVVTDNYVFATLDHFTLGGVGFSVAGTSTLYNFYQNALFTNPGGDVQAFNISVAAQAVPEPATWAMMLIGFGAVGYAARRRQKVSVSYAI